MDILFILGLLGIMISGLVMGLTGGGGSILSMPVLVYLLGITPFLSRTYSLFIVGIGAFFGVFQYLKRKQVKIPIALIFWAPSFITIYYTSKYIMPMIPEEIHLSPKIWISKNALIMISFSIVMLLSAISMLGDREKAVGRSAGLNGSNIVITLLLGTLVGVLTEFLGAGGGFLIVPSLIIFLGLPIREAIGTSLLVICLNSLTGIVFHINTDGISPTFVLTVCSMNIIGVLLGSYYSSKINASLLKKGFGVFIIVIAVFILFQEIILK